MEEAAALAKLIRTYHLSQEEAARKIGKSQSAVANKLRLLRLPPDALALLREHGFTERHARALLRLEEPEQQGNPEKLFFVEKQQMEEQYSIPAAFAAYTEYFKHRY